MAAAVGVAPGLVVPHGIFFFVVITEDGIRRFFEVAVGRNHVGFAIVEAMRLVATPDIGLQILLVVLVQPAK